jgi:hypothetical protein
MVGQRLPARLAARSIGFLMGCRNLIPGAAP